MFTLSQHAGGCQDYPIGHGFPLDRFKNFHNNHVVDGHIRRCLFIHLSCVQYGKINRLVIDYNCVVFVCLTDKPETCASTSSSVLSRQFQRKSLPLVGGAPCSQNQGYCDKFHVCRLLDADGPIARLKNSVLHLDDFEDVGEWMKVKVTWD